MRVHLAYRQAFRATFGLLCSMPLEAVLQRRFPKHTFEDYMKNHPIYYAGPAKTPTGLASGSFGPTTAGRMDTYVPIFQKHGASMITLAKGNRSKQVTDACKEHTREAPKGGVSRTGSLGSGATSGAEASRGQNPPESPTAAKQARQSTASSCSGARRWGAKHGSTGRRRRPRLRRKVDRTMCRGGRPTYS